MSSWRSCLTFGLAILLQVVVQTQAFASSVHILKSYAARKSYQSKGIHIRSNCALHGASSKTGGTEGALPLVLVNIAAIAFLFNQPSDVRHLTICTNDRQIEEKICVPFKTWADVVFNGAAIPEGTKLSYPFGKSQLKAARMLGLQQSKTDLFLEQQAEDGEGSGKIASLTIQR